MAVAPNDQSRFLVAEASLALDGMSDSVAIVVTVEQRAKGSV